MNNSDVDGCKWVPTGHPFPEVLKHYLNYRSAGTAELGTIDFQEWLIRSKVVSSPNTARSYCFPIREGEFDLVTLPVTALKVIAAGGWEGLLEVNRGRDFFLPGDDHRQVCLVAVWLVGHFHEESHRLGKTAEALLIARGFAGTPNSAQTLLSVGKAVGRHFQLLDKNSLPTKYFELLFRYVRKCIALGNR
ncbi:hypothetical protein ACNFBT_12315 [Pseudomonas sp. NY15181]|uniref:hypothetical protein n=1 Tax=Pseudomonas sp. NY15181 TaxID=3400349 RepID=UPI003A8949C7